MKHKIISFITILFFLTCSVLFMDSSWFFLFITFISVSYLILTIYGSFQIKANYFFTSINKGGTEGIALSFDDGPDPELTPKILSLLREQKIKATFFVIGKKAEQHPEILNAMDADGHIIANHTYTHSRAMGFFRTNKLSSDIEMCSDIIERITGKKPLFFRPPFGVTNPRYSKVLRKLKLFSIGWSSRSFDTVTENKNVLLKRVKKSIKKGAILLFHDTQNITMEALPDIIEYCHKNAIKIVPLQELINRNPYEVV